MRLVHHGGSTNLCRVDFFWWDRGAPKKSISATTHFVSIFGLSQFLDRLASEGGISVLFAFLNRSGRWSRRSIDK